MQFRDFYNQASGPAADDDPLDKLRGDLERRFGDIGIALAGLSTKQFAADLSGDTLVLSQIHERHKESLLIVDQTDENEFRLIEANAGKNERPIYAGPLDEKFYDAIDNEIVYNMLESHERDALARLDDPRRQEEIDYLEKLFTTRPPSP